MNTEPYTAKALGIGYLFGFISALFLGLLATRVAEQQEREARQVSQMCVSGLRQAGAEISRTKTHIAILRAQWAEDLEQARRAKLVTYDVSRGTLTTD